MYAEERNALVSCSGETSKAATYGPIVAPCVLIATCESFGKRSNSLSRTCTNPDGSSDTSFSYAAWLTGGGGGGLTSYVKRTSGNWKVVDSIVNAQSGSGSRDDPLGHMPSAIAKKQLAMTSSILIDDAKDAVEQMSRRSSIAASLGPDVRLLRACSIRLSNVGSLSTKLCPYASLNCCCTSLMLSRLNIRR